VLATVRNEASLGFAPAIGFGSPGRRSPVSRDSALDSHRNLLLSAISNPPVHY
jgi:hypothetical protein